MFLLEVSLFPFVIFVMTLGTSASHSNSSLLFTKPLSNLSLAAWRLLSGSILLSIELSLIVGFYNWRYSASWPLAGGLLFTIALWFAVQPFLCLASKSIGNMLVTMIPPALMAVWLMTRYKSFDGKQHDWDTITLFETSQLFCIIVAFAWLSVGCVAMARRGDGLGFPGWCGRAWQTISEWLDTKPLNARRFRSARRACFGTNGVGKVGECWLRIFS